MGGPTASGSFAGRLGSGILGSLRKVQEEYRQTFEQHGCRLTYLRPNLLEVEYPSEDQRKWLGVNLKKAHGDNFLLLNLSGATYETEDFEGPVLDVQVFGAASSAAASSAAAAVDEASSARKKKASSSKNPEAVGLLLSPVLPLDVLYRLCASVQKWLSADPANVVAVHGEPDFSGRPPSSSKEDEKRGFSSESGGRSWHHPSGRSALFLACYLSYAGLCSHPKEGFAEVCRALRMDPEMDSLRSVIRYMGYFDLLLSGFKVPVAGCFRLSRLVVTGLVVPRKMCGPWAGSGGEKNLQEEGGVPGTPAALQGSPPPVLEVWQGNALLFAESFEVTTSATALQGAEGTPDDGEEDRDYGKTAAEEDVVVLDQCFVPGSSMALVVGDLLVRVRGFSPGEAKNRDGGVVLLQAAFHTAFTDNGFLRFLRPELEHLPRLPPELPGCGGCPDARIPESSPDSCVLDVILQPVPASELDARVANPQAEGSGVRFARPCMEEALRGQDLLGKAQTRRAAEKTEAEARDLAARLGATDTDNLPPMFEGDSSSVEAASLEKPSPLPAAQVLGKPSFLQGETEEFGQELDKIAAMPWGDTTTPGKNGDGDGEKATRSTVSRTQEIDDFFAELDALAKLSPERR